MKGLIPHTKALRLYPINKEKLLNSFLINILSFVFCKYYSGSREEDRLEWTSRLKAEKPIKKLIRRKKKQTHRY